MLAASEGGSNAADEDPAGDTADTAPGPSSWIKNIFLKVTTSPTLSIAVQNQLPVAVIAVERYLAQSCTGSTETLTSSHPAPEFCYDLTISDGVYQDKWYLATHLNVLVQRNILRCGMEVNITKCSCTYDEKRIGWGSVCIEELECGRDVSDLKTVPFRQKEHADKPDMPLRGGRKHYLSLWNNEDPYGGMWLQSKLPEDQLAIDVSKVISLSILDMTWKQLTTFPPLLVRILHKSRLRYFGKPDKKHDMPYQVYFEVADHSGMMSMVLWNTLCLEWFKSLRVGTVLLLQQYVVKTSYTSRTLPTARVPQMKRFATIEICLNPRNPASNIKIISEKLVKPEWKLPEVKYHFITRSELNSLPHNYSCDVIGLVTFVGRSERLKKKDDGEEFWMYRWVHVIDGTSDQPLVLELFATSQPDIFEHIHPMSYLVCTQMRVVRDSPERTSSTTRLTTSNESQIFITGFHRGQPYTSDMKVKRFIQWVRTQSEAELIKKTAIGGYYHFPPVPDTFSKYCKDSKVASVLTTFGELKEELGKLHYREHKRIAVQGIIAALRFVSDSNVANNVSGLDPIQQDNPSSLTSETEESVESPSLLSDEKQLEESGCAHNSDNLALISQQSSVKEGQPNPSKRRKIQSDPEAQHHPVSREEFSVDEESSDAVSDSFQPDEHGTNEAPGEGEVKEGIWESQLWWRVKDNLKEHIQYCPILLESIPRQFDYAHKELLMQQYNVQPSKHVPKYNRSNKAIHEFKAAHSLGHYILTILDINQKVAIDVAYFPIFGFDDNQILDTSQVQETQLPSDSVNLSNDNCFKTLLQRFPLLGEIVESVRDLDRIHLICILDICHLGEEHVELCLNRIYNPAWETDAANQQF